MTSEELVEFVKNELDAEQQRQANAAALAAGALPTDQQTGSTLDLSHCNISALPAEVILLIKDRVERCVNRRTWQETREAHETDGTQTGTFTQPQHSIGTRDSAV